MLNYLKGNRLSIILAILGLLCFSYAYWNYSKLLRAENTSQQLAGEKKALREQAERFKKHAEIKDIEATEMAEAAKSAESKALAEHRKSEELKKKLASLTGPVPVIPHTPSDDPVVLRDQIIAQLDIENQSLHEENTLLKTQVETITSSRDAWKLTSDKFEHALRVSEQQTRSKEIVIGAMKRQNTMDKATYGGAGAALGYLIKALGVL